MNFMDKMSEHGLGNFEIRDDTISHRADGDNISRRFSQHILCFKPYCQNPVFGSVIGSDRHHGRLTQNNPLAFHIHQCIGCSQIYGQVT